MAGLVPATPITWLRGAVQVPAILDLGKRDVRLERLGRGRCRLWDPKGCAGSARLQVQRSKGLSGKSTASY
jgi:hypothetical protein